MRRLLVLLVAVLLALFAAPAYAQDDSDDPVSNDDLEQVDPDDEDGVGDDEDVDDYTDGCDYTSGEGDYTYCGCRGVSADGDYVYCPLASGEGGDKRSKGGEGPEILPAAVGTLSATSLPLTGYDPVPVAVLGLGLVMIGVGGRLRLASKAARPSR